MFSSLQHGSSFIRPQIQVVAEPSPEPPLRRPSGLPNQKRRAPAKLNDAAPPPRLRRIQPLPSAPTSQAAPVSDPVHVPKPEPQKWIRTEPNRFGLYKVYPQRPTHDPDELITTNDLYRAPQATQLDPEDLPLPREPWYYPFPNASVAHLMKYHIEEENAGSIGAFDRLISNILTSTQRGSGV
ncbi:hypothetical protein MIND_01121900 [Mycena indigotica]|uniref:Uncharacterized protein n=1 Tax=Mycena indigotica TaxID=2126181 RepID=A0A8H6VTL5_9AGAR|nr:uncharacterized protein MIND_01121900 [Mycena indigotica]KAF7293444.1 hypothetical protein MIND_01121900 [Mycena indigotica]